jgi:hypothetical protein
VYPLKKPSEGSELFGGERREQGTKHFHRILDGLAKHQRSSPREVDLHAPLIEPIDAAREKALALELAY